MLYVETTIASLVFGVGVDAIKKGAQRNSEKYPFVRLENTGKQSRGGVRLLFEVQVSDIDMAIKDKKLNRDVNVYIYEENKYKQLKFSEIKPKNEIKNDDEGAYLNASEEELKEAREKRGILKRYEIAKANKMPCAKFCEMENISKTNLFRWQKEYKEKGLKGLLDRRGKKSGSYKLKSWMKEFIIDEFRAYGAGDINITQIWKNLHEEYGKRTGKFNGVEFIQGSVTPLFDTGVVKRYIDEYYKKNIIEYTLVTKGMDKCISHLEPAYGTQGIMVTRRNQCWQIDSSKLDAIVRDGEGGVQIRPNILSIIDVYSGRCVATLAETSNSLALTRLLWRAIEILGKPECIKGDNGKDYVSDAFQDLLEGLGIDYDAARAYHGKDKGFVERHFGTLQRSKMAHTPGYIGGNLARREAIEQQTPKKERHAKDKFGHKTKTNQENLLTYEEMKKRFEAAVLQWDMTAIKRKKSAPIIRWNSDDTPLKTIPYERFVLFAGSKGIHKVGKKGITIDGVRYASRFLPPVKTEVRVSVNIDNVSEAFVFDINGKFICKAKDAKILSFSAEEFVAATKMFNENIRAIRRVIKSSKVSTFTRLNVEYDLAVTKKAHKDALKKEDKVLESSNLDELKAHIKANSEIESIKSASFDYSKYENINEANKPKKFSLDDAIKIASGE